MKVSSLICALFSLSFSSIFVDSTFFDIDVDLPVSDPAWYSEAGRSASPPLIAGYQVVYQAGPEPRSSNNFCVKDRKSVV